MRRISMLLMMAAGLFFSYGSAQASTVKVTGTVDWTALTHFNTAKSGEVVFVDITDFENPVFTVVPLTKISNKQSKYSVTLNGNTPYFVAAVIADCATNPEQCGTATVAGTHIRFNDFVHPTPDGGPPITINLTADPMVDPLDPVAICGSVSVQSGTFVKALASAGPGGEEQFFSVGVFSTALVTPPASSYCVQGARFSFGEVDSTVTIQQTQVPTCPNQLDVLRSDSLIIGSDPITDNIAIVVPGAPGEISGTFSVAGFAHDFTFVQGSNSGPTIGDCAGIRGFGSGSGPGQAATFDVTPALSGTWKVLASGQRRLNSPDGLLQITESATPMNGSDVITVNLPPGGSAVVPLSYTPGIVAGNITFDVRRLGALNGPPLVSTYEGIPRNNTNGVVGAGWTPSVVAIPPMRFTERYELNLDPRGTDWLLRAANIESFGYNFSSANAIASSSWSFVTLPNRFGTPFFWTAAGDFATPIGSVTAGATTSLDLPVVDFRVANVTLNSPPGFTSISWVGSNGQYALPNGVLFTTSSLNASTFDGSPAVGRMNAPHAIYPGTTTVVDSNFNSRSDQRQLDLESDDDLTADFGAPMLLAVRPIPGAAGGSATVTGRVVSSDPTVTSLQVSVNGANATIGAGGTFSRAATIGTGPLTIVASDNLGRTTTLKRYFTTMTGLFAPAAGADLVSQGADVNAIQFVSFTQPPLPASSFNIGRTIPLKLTGALGSAAVTSANAAAAPRVIAVLQAAAGAAATAVRPSGGETVFHFDSGAAQWICNLGTTGLTAGTYVVQIQFWDGRILEAAFVLA
jgi:hypothetical protein